jgi:uncharacterized protein
MNTRPAEPGPPGWPGLQSAREGRAPATVPWRGRDAIGAFVLTVVLIGAVGVAGRRVEVSVLFPILTAMVGVAAVVWASFYRRPGALLGTRFRIGLRALGVAAAGWLGVVAAQIVLGLAVVALLGPDAVPEAGGLPPELAEAPGWSLALAAVVIAPIAEELFFRGFLLQGLARSYGPGVATAGSAAVFGLFHFSGPGAQSVLPILSAVVVGLVLGWLFVRTKNLAIPIAAHALVNAAALALAGLLSS